MAVPRGASLLLTTALVMSVMSAACRGSIGQPNESFDRWRDRMPGPGMMRRWRDQMPGPWMGDQQFPTPEVTPAPTTTPGGTARVSYGKDIQPIFDRKCVGCHGGQAGLYLDSFDHLMSGSANGAVVVPADPSGSELVMRIKGWSQPRMPPQGSALSASDIDKITAWIAEGCPNN